MENNGTKNNGVFSRKLRAGKKRTYFFDVKNTKQGDYFITLTESKKRFEGEGYESHKLFLYKEDFKKFMEALQETINHVKTELMPEYDFDAERPARPEFNENSHKEKGDYLEKPIATSTKSDAAPATHETSEYTSTSTIPDDEEMNWS